MAEHEPYTSFDPATSIGSVAVLGPEGAIPDPVAAVVAHDISAIWAEDQHGTVMAFQEFGPTDRPVPPLALGAATPAAIEIHPFAYSDANGLFEGSDVWRKTHRETTPR